MGRIIVENFEYKTAKSPDSLFACVGPCIVIGAIYGKKGYMFHHVPVGDYYEIIKPIFNHLKRDAKDKNKLKLYVAGGGIYMEDYTDATLMARDDVLRKIKECGFEKSVEFIKWCKIGRSQSLELILDEGIAELDENRDDELIDDMYCE
jgi:hypothetical protein